MNNKRTKLKTRKVIITEQFPETLGSCQISIPVASVLGFHGMEYPYFCLHYAKTMSMNNATEDLA